MNRASIQFKIICSLITAFLIIGFYPSSLFVAFADDNNQSGSGTTDLKVKLFDSSEHGGYGIDNGNPKDSNNDWGENIAFQVPTNINFITKADGTLIAPSADAVYVENLSAFADHVSSLQIVSQNNYGESFCYISEDHSESTISADLTIGIAPAFCI